MTPTLDTKIGRYLWNEKWAEIPPSENGRTHGVAVSRDGRVFVFHQASPALLVYDPQGHLITRWGEYPGAHGVTLIEEDGVEMFWLTDQRRGVVEKTTLDGEILRSVPRPPIPVYENGKYAPTWATENERRHGGNGDIWIADGYGLHLVHRYDVAGNYLGSIDGVDGAGRLDCPHGIWFGGDGNARELYIADRGNRRIQVYDGEGKYLRCIGDGFLTSPDIGVVWEEYLLVPELYGQLIVLNRSSQLVDSIGRNAEINKSPNWPDKTPLEVGKFNSPHGIAVNDLGDIFIAEWRLGGRIIKLERV